MKLASKLISLIMALNFLSGAVAINAQPSAQSALTHIKQAGFISTTIAPVFIAVQKGFFHDENIDLELVEVDSTPLAVTALVTNQVQITDLGVSDVINLQSQGKDPILFYNNVNTLSQRVVVSSAVIRKTGVTPQSPLNDRIKALKGLTIGISRPGGQNDLYVRWLLKQAGLNPDADANFVTIGGGAALLGALESGQIDAYMAAPPTPLIAEKDGTGTILINGAPGDVPQFEDFSYSSMAVSKTWAEAHPRVVEGYSRALDKAYAFLFQHTDEAVQILHSKYFPDTPVDTLTLSVKAALEDVKPDGKISEEAIKNQASVLEDIGAIDRMPDTTEGVLWTNQWNPDTLTDLELPTTEATASGS